MAGGRRGRRTPRAGAGVQEHDRVVATEPALPGVVDQASHRPGSVDRAITGPDLFCVPLLVRLAQRSAEARQSDQNFDDDIAAVHQTFMGEWQSIRLDAKDDRHREQMRKEWLDRYNSALREVYDRHGREMPSIDPSEPLLPLEEPVERPVVFQALTHRSALRATKSITFRVELDSSEDTQYGWVIHDCKGDDESVLFTV